jgi:hypothetical protein
LRYLQVWRYHAENDGEKGAPGYWDPVVWCGGVLQVRRRHRLA